MRYSQTFALATFILGDRSVRPPIQIRRGSRARRPGQGSYDTRFAVLLGVTLSLMPPAASADTLPDALAKAYVANPTLQAERAQLRVTDENLPQAIAQRRPTITAQGNVGLEHQLSSLDGSQDLFQRSASLSVTQPL